MHTYEERAVYMCGSFTISTLQFDVFVREKRTWSYVTSLRDKCNPQYGIGAKPVPRDPSISWIASFQGCHPGTKSNKEAMTFLKSTPTETYLTPFSRVLSYKSAGPGWRMPPEFGLDESRNRVKIVGVGGFVCHTGVLDRNWFIPLKNPLVHDQKAAEPTNSTHNHYSQT